MFKAAHISDTHIRNLKYHTEYKIIFQRIYDKLNELKPNVIVHTGDIAHTKTQISPEFVEMTANFFENLAKIAPVLIILGNHDGNLRNSNRQDAISPIINALNNPNIKLLKNSGEYPFSATVTFNVLSVFDKENWVQPTNPDIINIALYHGTISGVKTDIGHTLEYGEYDSGIFKNFDFAFLGDIHKTNQKIDSEGRYRYAGSTVQQNHGETEDKGFLFWEIKNRLEWDVEHVAIANPKPFISIILTKTGQLPKNIIVPKGARLRIVAENNLSLDKVRKAIDVAKVKFKPEAITYLNRSGGGGSVDGLIDGFEKEDLRDPGVQERLMKEYLEDYHCEEDVLGRVFALNKKYDEKVQKDEGIARNVNFEILELEWDNLFKYGEKNRVVFSSLNGVVGIFGKNFSGKSSIIDTLLYAIYGSISKNARKTIDLINHHKESCSAKVKLRIGTKVYTIDRSSEKYLKKLKGNVSLEAKTAVDFTVFDEATNVIKSLNGETRAKTDKIIRKYFGTLEDFLMTSMSSQWGAMNFLDETSTKRAEILGRFLDVGFFTKKYSLANDDAKELKGVLKKLENGNFDEDIKKVQRKLKKNLEKTEERKSECEEIKSEIEDLRLKISDIEKDIDVETELIDIDEILKDIEENKVENEALLIHIDTNQNVQKQLRESIELERDIVAALDIASLSQQEKKYQELSNALTSVSASIKQKETEAKQHYVNAALLNSIPCGDKYPNCSLISSAQQAKKEIDIVELVLQKENERAVSISEELNKHPSVNEQIEYFDSLQERIKHNQSQLEKKMLEMSGFDLGKARLRQEYDSLVEKKKKFYANEKAIAKAQELVKVRDGYLSDITMKESQKERCDKYLLELYKTHGSLEQKFNRLTQDKQELEDARGNFEAFDLYLKCMHPKGIAYDIIKKSLPAINREIEKILANIVEFKVFFVSDDNRLDVFLQRPKDFVPSPIEMCSGAEKTIAAMAIRLAFISISSIPRGDIFILDEPGTALDEERMDGFVQILGLIKSFFRCVILISHLDSLKDSADTLIDIQNRGKFAFVEAP